MRNKKTVYFLYEAYECSALEEYFEAMAESGWLIKSINRPFLRFEKIEPKKLKFSVDILNKISKYDPDDSDDALDYREYCEAAGWKYVCQDKKIQVFYTDDYNKAIDIQTDESEKFKSVVKASLGNMFLYFFIVFIWVFNIKMRFYGDISYTLASNFSIFSLFLMFSLILIYSNKPISFIIWALKSKKRIRENKSMKYNNYKQLKLKNIFISSITVIYFVLFAVFMLSDDTVTIRGGVLFAVLLFSVIIGSIFVARYIRKKRYSRQTNITLAIGGGLAYIFISLVLVGVLITFGTLDHYDRNKVPKDKIELTLSDFGYEENNDVYANYSRSIVAEKLYYSNSGEGDEYISYTLLKSKYQFLIELQEKSLVKQIGKIMDDLELVDTNLPKDIKVYTYRNEESYIFVSKNRAIQVYTKFKDIDKDKFIDVIYEKLLKES
ncbi:DUF2812 domain-containing protein [Clostridium intestinale]|uniref:DUF2812 domain-containing protein n=1 Tax=Clostridium intestinale URNW TaxID=1294142 RepID=U2N0B6_9CLOT|nr:DUF2812 domain-containing protein [Clostridium intestinale]ERK28937.1 hypothetical protein CINTURNW_3805 [Clostridium intestinale URNW]